MLFYSTTLISKTRGVKNGVKGCPKRHLLHRMDYMTVSLRWGHCDSMPAKSTPHFISDLSYDFRFNRNHLKQRSNLATFSSL
jgi:hypothetical protein